MSRRALSLPIRTLSRQHQQSWTCRRCLATQAEAVAPGEPRPSMPSPSNVPTNNGYEPSLPASQRIDSATGQRYELRTGDRALKKALPHPIPVQYLQHSTSRILSIKEKMQREKTEAHKRIVGVVVSAGKMEKTVKVRVPGQTWNKKIGKYFASHTNHLVHDPNSSLTPGDVVSLHRLRVSTAVHHVVASIVAPFGTPVESRNPIPSPDDRLAAYKEKRFKKLRRRDLRRQAAAGDAEAITTLREMGLDPGDGVEAAVGQAGNSEKKAGRQRNPTAVGIVGNKGQKLPKGVLPGGKHEVGKIDARAKRNKESAMKLNEKAEQNLLEAEEKGTKLESMGLGTDSVFGDGRQARGTSKQGNEG